MTLCSVLGQSTAQTVSSCQINNLTFLMFKFPSNPFLKRKGGEERFSAQRIDLIHGSLSTKCPQTVPLRTVKLLTSAIPSLQPSFGKLEEKPRTLSLLLNWEQGCCLGSAALAGQIRLGLKCFTRAVSPQSFKFKCRRRWPFKK